MQIPLMNLKRLHQNIRKEIDIAVSDIFDDNNFINGNAVKEFETNFSKICGLKHIIACSNGTDAIQVVLHALNIGEGDEVIVPTMTFIATSEAVNSVGAKVKFVDISPDDYCIDPKQVINAINIKTKAVIAVNLHGNPAKLNELQIICKERNVLLIEDSAQAHLAKINNKVVGSFGIATTFSFFPGKNLGAFGDAGAIGTNDDALALKLSKLVNHGRKNKYEHEMIGFNMRMDTLQAAVLNVKLKYLLEWTEKRRAIAKRYNLLLSNLPVILPFYSENVYNVFHLYVIRLKNRDNVLKYLQDNGIEAGIHYPLPLHLQPAYKHLDYKTDDFPVAELCAAEFLSLPLCPMLTNEEQDYIIKTLKDVIK